MLGLGSSIVKGGAGAKTIVTDNLVLKHNYDTGRVHQVSTGAAFFDGTDDYITMGDACDLGTTDFSVSFWAYVPEATSQNFISKYEDSNIRWFIRSQGTDKIQFLAGVSDGSGGSTTVMDITYDGDDVPQNAWFHVAVTCDRSDGSSGMKIYLNGVVGTANAGSATNINNAGNLEFGRQSTTEMGGYMTNVGIWNGTALTQAQIKSIMWKNYSALTSTEKTNLTSWWNLNENANDNHGSNNGTLS